jgi:hypothetical protein
MWAINVVVIQIQIKMNKLIKHSWQPSDGFRTHTCIHCGLIRYWDDSFKKVMYKTKWQIYYFDMPKCKRIMHCDKIELEPLTNLYNHNRKI